MHINSKEVMEIEREKAVLVSLITADQTEGTDSLAELVRLAETAGVHVVQTMIQQRQSPDSRWFIGKGKVSELAGVLRAHDATTAIFDQELSGAQVRNLEEALDAKIIDRNQLILDIFAQRAKTREGILQVELAQLSYLLPRLAGHGINLSRLGGGIGTRGPGETKLETDRRHIRQRISDLKNQLKEVVRHRELYRERRKRTGILQVALVGYTNAGKSTLLKKLTGADVYVEDQLFATLDPTSRQLKLPIGREIIVTDTVGFIQNLPHDLVNAFRATLEEVNEADLILHVVDGASSQYEAQMVVVDQVLHDLGAHTKEQLIVYNKADLLQADVSEWERNGKNQIQISAYNDDDIERLKLKIQTLLAGSLRKLRLPIERGDLLALLHRYGEVVWKDSESTTNIEIHVQIRDDEFARIGNELQLYEIQNT